MFEWDGTNVVIDNPLIRSFVVSQKDNAPLLRCLEDVVEMNCRIMSDCLGKFSQYEDNRDKVLIQYLETMQDKLAERDIKREKVSVTNMEHTISHITASLMTSVGNVVSDKVDKLDPRHLQGAITEAVRNAVSSSTDGLGKIQFETLQNSSMIRNDTTELRKRLEDVDRRLNYRTSKEKGIDGERKIFDLLAGNKRLRNKDGFTVEDVHGQPHKGDIQLNRIGYVPICIELKNHGESTGESVRTSEVEKFYKDLDNTQNHGIFVSLHSGIVGKDSFEIERLPNHKFAVFIARNGYNIDQIIDGILMVNYLEKQFQQYDGEDDGSFRITQGTIELVKTHMQIYESAIKDTRDHINKALKSLSAISFSQLLTLLIGQSAAGPSVSGTTGSRTRKITLPVPSHKFTCWQCGDLFNTSSASSMHRKENRCSKRLLHSSEEITPTELDLPLN